MKYSDEEIMEIIKILKVFTKVEVNYLLNKKVNEKCNPKIKGRTKIQEVIEELELNNFRRVLQMLIETVLLLLKRLR
jgi:hypothetical protein